MWRGPDVLPSPILRDRGLPGDRPRRRKISALHRRLWESGEAHARVCSFASRNSRSTPYASPMAAYDLITSSIISLHRRQYSRGCPFTLRVLRDHRADGRCAPKIRSVLAERKRSRLKRLSGAHVDLRRQFIRQQEKLRTHCRGSKLGLEERATIRSEFSTEASILSPG